jgi:epoxyqueuosine reductase
MLTSSSVKSQAAALGFDLCGIAAADSYPELSFLREWLDRGYAGDMAWMARNADRRADVRKVVPGARSVIVTATLYNTVNPTNASQRGASAPAGGNPEPSASGSQPQAREPDRALISRYAWGDDYHIVLKRRLDALVEWMRGQSAAPFDARAYVDTGPVQERVYAQYAGLGWIGKNTCLINPELGSWLFLGEIISTLPLEPDAQGLEQCGTCTKCLDACPTGALVEPWVLDSTRCISYLTIELRTSIPEALRPAMGAHTYGCDICQDVCPYNQPAPVSGDAAWQPRPGLDLPALVDLWRSPDAELRRLTKGTAMTRAKLTGLRRNIAVAIGNSGEDTARAALDGRSDDRPSADDEIVREHVQWALHVPAPVRADPSLPE